MAMDDVDLVPLIQRAIVDVGHTLAAIRPAQWHDPTPCTEWDVAEVAAHLVGGLDGFGAIAEGKPMPDDGPPIDWATAAAAYEKASCPRWRPRAARRSGRALPAPSRR